MRKKIIICRGCPASGKTTWAKQYCKDNPDTIRVNRDDIRDMLSIPYSKNAEILVKDIEDSIIKDAIYNNFNVVVDDTNLQSIEHIMDIVYNTDPRNKLIVDYKNFFDVSLAELIHRNSLRPKKTKVPEETIKAFYAKQAILQSKENKENSTSI